MPEDAAAQKARIARQFIEAIPHARDLGMELLEIGDGWAVMALDYDPRFVGDPATGVLHGGVVTALLDTCVGRQRDGASRGARRGTATIDLRIDYMRPAPPGRRLYRPGRVLPACTRTVAFIRGFAYTETPRRARSPPASGAFTVEGAR